VCVFAKRTNQQLPTWQRDLCGTCGNRPENERSREACITRTGEFRHVIFCSEQKKVCTAQEQFEETCPLDQIAPQLATVS